MLRVRRMCMELKRTYSEVKHLPAEDLEMFDVFMSISSKDKPIIKERTAEQVHVKESKAMFRAVFG